MRGERESRRELASNSCQSRSLRSTDGRVFVRLINKLQANLIDESTTASLDDKARVKLAFEVAERELGIPIVLTSPRRSQRAAREDRSTINYDLLEFLQEFQACVEGEANVDDDETNRCNQAIIAPSGDE